MAKALPKINDIEKTNNELARNILSVDGVVSIFFSDDFISVNKKSEIDWEDLKHIIISFINDFYSGIARFKFKDLCDNNLGAEDYINISNICKHIFIEEIPNFNNENSNQQLRFITMIDILYEKKIRLTLSIEENLNNLSSSNKHSEVFKRTISRMFEMTKSP